MWPVYSRILRETFAGAISADEAALIAAALDRAKTAAAAIPPSTAARSCALTRPGARAPSHCDINSSSVPVTATGGAAVSSKTAPAAARILDRTRAHYARIRSARSAASVG